jgi:hypothetical protein
LIRYWLTPAPDERFDEKVDDINSLYQQAQNLAQKGEFVMSIDEMTGVQALERKHPGLPMAPGKVERREFEYLISDDLLPTSLVSRRVESPL